MTASDETKNKKITRLCYYYEYIVSLEILAYRIGDETSCILYMRLERFHMLFSAQFA